MKCNTCRNESYCYDGNHQLTRDGCADNGFAAYVPQTNADRIRRMTDAELAEWVKLMVCKYRSCGNCPMSDWCEPGKGIAEWLKAPVEVDNGT